MTVNKRYCIYDRRDGTCCIERLQDEGISPKLWDKASHASALRLIGLTYHISFTNLREEDTRHAHQVTI